MIDLIFHEPSSARASNIPQASLHASGAIGLNIAARKLMGVDDLKFFRIATASTHQGFFLIGCDGGSGSYRISGNNTNSISVGAVSFFRDQGIDPKLTRIAYDIEDTGETRGKYPVWWLRPRIQEARKKTHKTKLQNVA